MPGQYKYRLELLDAYPTSVIGKQYLEFMEEVGVECVDTSFKWVYFRKKATSEPFDIYTDVKSKKRHLNRVISTLILGWSANLFFATVNTFSDNALYITRYFTILNWIAVLVFIPVILNYFKMKRVIDQDI